MSNDLAMLQEQIFNLVFNINDNALSQIETKGGISAADRFDINRQTVFSGLVRGLKLIFPKTWQLIGEKCAKGAALAYINQIGTLPTKLCLDHWGENFPEFIGKFKTTKPFIYLEDFARLEYLYHLSEQADEFKIITAANLQQISPQTIESKHLQLNNSVYLMETTFPLDQIRNIINEEKSNTIPKITLKQRYILICRVHGVVEIIWLKEEDFKFLQSLYQSKNLGQAMENFSTEQISEKLTHIFNFLLQKNMICKIY